MKNNLQILLVTLFGFVTPSYATVYKWIDKDNHVQYSSTPPAEEITATKIAPPPKPSSSAAEEKSQAIKMQNQLEVREQKEAADKIKEQQANEEATKRSINCQKAKKHLEDMESKPRISLEQPDKSYKILSEEERAAEIQKTKNDVNQYCQPSPTAAPHPLP